MNFDYTPKVEALRARLLAFFDEHIYPNEFVYHEEVERNRANGNAWVPTEIVEKLKIKAREAGLDARVFTDENEADLWLRHGERARSA